ncbi:DinB family protein [Christiangramia sabulilitoris]|uniref:DinB family protein n=1 Tax=Christiangramia sabulilitoris TaxID=2583991 RepID=A0A550I8C7_9FLAO|nr:DinB family protein [Christiangramia sabulilitoris]TRO67240.1 DinB family protein [Christiangramia sabulilitoris]
MKKMTNEIIRAMSETFEGQPWYGDSVMRKLENVPYVIGYKTCIPESHSVAQIVGHLIAWKKFAAKKMSGCKDCHLEKDSEEDWPNIDVHSREEWEELKRELVAAQSSIYEILNEQEDDSFLQKKVDGKDYDFGALLKGLIQHDIYHLGQIGLIESQLKKKEIDSGIFRT